MDLDVMAYRALFPALGRQIYLNHAGVSPTSLRVAEAVAAWMDDLVQNGVGNENAWEARAESARARAARLVGAKPGEIAFVRNTSHGLGLVAEGIPWRTGDEVAVASSLEYPSNVYPWLHLAERGVVVKAIRAERGVTVEAVRDALTPRTRLVSVSSVQYASGHRTPLDELGRLCEERGLLFCVDGIQSVGCIPVDVKKSRIHFLSADSHKWMLGINGTGFLYVDADVLPTIRPVLVGWKSTTDAWNFNRAHFELRTDGAKFEEGSPAYTGLYALDATIALLEEVGVATIEARVGRLLARLDRGLQALGCETFPEAQERAGILTFVPPKGRDMDALVAHLTAGRFNLSLRRDRLRISPHFYNLEEEMDALVEAVRTFLA